MTSTQSGNRSGSYGVYVIELGRSANRYLDLEPGLELPCVYVGQSWHSPEKRFAIHKAGGFHASSIVVRNGIRLRPDLYEHLPRVRTKEEAEELEAAHARNLAGLGFHSYFDGSLLRPQHCPPTPESQAMQTSEHLEVVSDYVDRAIFAAVAALTQPDGPVEATPEKVATLLCAGGRAGEIPLSVPLTCRGRFAYLSPGPIGDRIGNLVASGFLFSTRDGRIYWSQPKEALA